LVAGLDQFFRVGELMRSDVQVHKAKHRNPVYGRWKESKLRKLTLKCVEFNVRGFNAVSVSTDFLSSFFLFVCLFLRLFFLFPYFHFPLLAWQVDMLMALLAIVLLILSALPKSHHTRAYAFANATTWIFVAEVLLKVLCFGVKGYWSEIWNRLDFLISCASVTGFIMDMLVDGNSTLIPIIQWLRLLRLFKLVSVLNNLGRFEKSGTFKDGYYTKLLESLSATIPVCMDIMLLQFFYVFMFAMVGMEVLSDTNTDTKVSYFDAGFVDFVGTDKSQFDWSGENFVRQNYSFLVEYILYIQIFMF
jgi:hypothetical protein